MHAYWSVALSLYFASAPPPQSNVVTLATGDLVFHRSTSRQAEAIALATKSAYTHVGVIFVDGDEVRVLEAVEPVQLTPLSSWLSRSADGQVLVRRLARPEAISPQVERDMRALAQRWLGVHYDLHFEWSDATLYCSELVYKLYERTAAIQVGELATLGDFDLGRPVVHKQMVQRYGPSLPLDQPVVSPAGQADDADFVTVYAGAVDGVRFGVTSGP